MENKGFIIGILVATILVALVRLCAFSLLVIPGNGEAPTLQAGDRVLVGRWSYGYRLPWSEKFGYHRWKMKPVLRDDWVVYNSPLVDGPQALTDTTALCVGRCLAQPGDTVWMGAHGTVSNYRNYASGQIWPLVVPGEGTYVRITPWNVRLYALTINRHEGVHATVQSDSLCINGRKVGYYRFHRNYYWMQSGDQANFNDSRTLGFVPHDFLQGRVQCIFYSLDPSLPWHRCWLWKRCLQVI